MGPHDDDLRRRPSFILNVPKELASSSENRSPNSPVTRTIDLSTKTGLSDRTSIKYVTLPPGTRLSAPLAHSHQDTLATCISGQGLVWQNGWTYPFGPEDAAGWKGGTGIPHTIINEGGPDAEDLVLLIAEELIPENKIHYPLGNPSGQELDAARNGTNQTTNPTPDNAENKTIIPESEDQKKGQVWESPPRQNDMGPHRAFSKYSFDGTIKEDTPEVFKGPRPSNIIHSLEGIAPLGKDDLYAEGTSLSEDTGLSGRIGINLEVGPPGVRSSDAHAHSLEDELVYVLAGEGILWINGFIHEVSAGDAVGFPAGTGIAHVFINDSNSQTEDDQPKASGRSNASEPEEDGCHLVLWIFGENKRRSGDRIFYPLNPEKEGAFDRWWDDCPYHDLGRHPGLPSKPRRD